MRRILKINQRRGSWVADVIGGRGAWDVVSPDDPRIAVIINDGDGRFDFKRRVYETFPAQSPFGAWWLAPEREEWRSLIGPSRPFVVRDKASELPSGAVVAGAKKGVFKMGEMEMTDERFFFVIDSRLGEVE